MKCLSLEDTEENREPGDRVKQRGPSQEEGGSSSRLSGNQGRNEGRMETSEARASTAEENKAHKSQLPKVRWEAGPAGILCQGRKYGFTLLCIFLMYGSSSCRAFGGRKTTFLSHNHSWRMCLPSLCGAQLPSSIWCSFRGAQVSALFVVNSFSV